MNWLYPAILSLISFGLWGLFSKLTVNHIDSKSAFLYQTIGVVIIGLIAWWNMGFKAMPDGKGMTFGILTGIAYGLGCLFYFMAASRGNITSVVTMTALYPLVTILLAFFFLHEGINLRQGLGIIFALVAMVLFAG